MKSLVKHLADAKGRMSRATAVNEQELEPPRRPMAPRKYRARKSLVIAYVI
jgi:hypothetical protein